jgi:hypothetical protein
MGKRTSSCSIDVDDAIVQAGVGLKLPPSVRAQYKDESNARFESKVEGN